jgi:hypothetical protein
MAPTAITGVRGLQETGSGLLTGYQGDALTGLGIPSLVGLIASDNKAATTGYGSTALYTTVSSGVFEITSYLDVYGPSGTGTMQAMVVFWGDDSGTPRVLNVGSAVSCNANVITAAPTLGRSGGSVLIMPSASTTIYGSTVITGGSGTPSYRFAMACKRLL